MPPVTSTSFSIFNCRDIFNDGDTYLTKDNDIKCWDGDHAFYANYIGIPTVLVWIIGLPAVALAVLFRVRN